MEEIKMASEKITAMIEELKTLTVLELSELVKAVEEEFGVSAAAAVAVAAPAAGGAAAAEEKTEFDVILKEAGADTVIHSNTSAYNPSGSGIQRRLQRVCILDSSSPLHIQRSPGCNALKHRQIAWFLCLGPIKVHDMKPGHAVILILLCHIERVGRIFLLLAVISLRQPDTSAVHQVNCRYYYSFHRFIKFLNIISPTSPLFSGWTCTP